MRSTKADTSRSHAGPLDILAALRERRTAWRVPELARLLSLGPRTIYDAIASGQLPAMRIGTALRINPTDALAWVEARTTGTERKAE